MAWTLQKANDGVVCPLEGKIDEIHIRGDASTYDTIRVVCASHPSERDWPLYYRTRNPRWPDYHPARHLNREVVADGKNFGQFGTPRRVDSHGTDG